MSNAGQVVGSVVGAVVGFFIGGPQGAVYGFQLGYGLSTLVFPTQLPHLQGPRLGEGQQTVSTIGQPIPLVFGTQPVGGNIIWASPIREVANTQEVGKGGPEQSQTTYTYYRSFAILLCEGPIGGVRRIWANGKVIYDARPQFDDESDEAFIERQAINQTFLEKVTIYLGTEDQMPDPTIESDKGVGNVPAYRGYAYMVFNDIELKPEDGNRIPASWKFEVYESGDSEDGVAEIYSNEVLYPWLAGDDPINPLNYHEAQNVQHGALSLVFGPWEGYGANPINEAIADAEALTSLSWRVYHGYSVTPAGDTNRLTGDQVGPNGDNDAISIYLRFNVHDGPTEVEPDTGGICEKLIEMGCAPGRGHSASGYFWHWVGCLQALNCLSISERGSRMAKHDQL